MFTFPPIQSAVLIIASANGDELRSYRIIGGASQNTF